MSRVSGSKRRAGFGWSMAGYEWVAPGGVPSGRGSGQDRDRLRHVIQRLRPALVAAVPAPADDRIGLNVSVIGLVRGMATRYD
jgi:hypothetical protein